MKRTPLTINDVLPLCCAAFRINGGYTKTHPYENFHIVKNTLYFPRVMYEGVPTCEVSDNDNILATEIKIYLRKHLSLSVLGRDSLDLEGYEQKFEQTVFKILEDDIVPYNKISTLCKVVEYFIKYKAFNEIKKASRFASNESLGKQNDIITNQDCEIIHVIKTKNYNGYNITGIINECMVTWFSPYILQIGKYHIDRALIKDRAYSYYAKKDADRLTQVKGYLIKDETTNPQ